MLNKEVKLIETIMNYSCEIKEGQQVILEMTGSPCRSFVEHLKIKLERMGAYVIILDKSYDVLSRQLKDCTEIDIKKRTEDELNVLKTTDVYIMIKSIMDPNGLEGVDDSIMSLYQEFYIKPIHRRVLNHTRWLSLRYPNEVMASDAGMSLEAFTDYYYDVCGIDYFNLSKAMDILVKMMSSTDKVHITGKGTDLRFSIKDMPVHKCDGKINLPDGEVYTAPIKTSVNGHITYNVPTRYRGYSCDSLKLHFKEGKIISCEGQDIKRVEAIFDTDDGARYIGEFALGVNPYVIKPIKDILFDEKLAGSFHLTPGFCYDNASNGNESSVHWDLICIQTDNYGGGEIYFDGVLIRKNGLFLDKRLSILNPS